jgi:3,4-dihydroxy 2-butanone 4-phosphate synthase
MDDFDRENEADLIIAAEKITTESMARLIRDCSGIVCLCLTDERLQQLDLPPMVAANGSRFGTAFTVTIEAKHGVTTGVSAADRVTTIKAAIADGAVPGDWRGPGMFFLCGQCLAEYYSGVVILRVLWIWCVWLECRRQRYYAN